MRIQHNIMAMSAYRNYTNNVSAMKKNLEKLSSGYKINRAGDDAAGLAISEKMRAQITGLETAQKNAKDGISLVQTAEGALTEVHDMLNRMVELASQSANGTYDDTTDRAQMQKEVNQLLSEINRIADSSNFNGIKLLDGSMSTDAAKITGDARIINDVYTTGNPAQLSGTKTFLDGEVATTATPTEFKVDFTGLNKAVLGGSTAGGTAAAKAKYSFDLSGVTADAANLGGKAIDGQTLTFTTDLDGTMNKFVTDYNGDDTKTYTANWDAANKKLTLEAKVAGLVGGTTTGVPAAAPTTDLTGTTTVAAKADVWKATVQLGGAFAAGETVTLADGTTKTVVADATGTGGDATKITETDANALGADDLKLTFATGAAKTGYTVTGDGTKEVTFTADVAGQVKAGNTGTTQPPAAAPVAGDLGTITVVGGGSRTATWTLTNTTPGADATTTPGAALTATEDVAGADATAPAGADTTVDFTFKIGNTEFTVNAANGNTLADGEGATEIATNVSNALTALANADGTVTIDGNKYTFADNGDGSLTFTLADTPTEDNIAANFDWDVTGLGDDSFQGNHTAGVIVTTPGAVEKPAPSANTVFKLEANDIKDGAKITIDGTSVILAVGKNSAYKTNLAANGAGTVAATGGSTGYVDLTWMEENGVDLNKAISAISEGFGGSVTGTESGTQWVVGVNDTSNGDTHPGLTVHKQAGTGTVTYDTKAKLAAIFSIEKEAGKGLNLQIGDTADPYNQLNVSIKDMHAASLGISGIDISTQEGATKAVDAIKAAINAVSDVRGTLGATQNRLDHTINNLSVMTENIQDAESSIRDVDVAEEMMAYTKNNILIQSAQAMLAQANQVPQGVLQLLQ